MVTERSRRKPAPRPRRRFKHIPPPKSVEELAREQGIDLDNPPDYSAIASDIWPTKGDVAAFDRHIRSIRGRPSH